MSLLEKLKKNSRIKETEVLMESSAYKDKPMITTEIPILNTALSGKLDGGIQPGLGILAGQSKHFKTGFSLVLAKAFLDANPDGVILFYDSEFGTPQSYWQSLGVDTDRVLHTPITDVEEFKFDVVHQLEEIKDGEKVMILVDSIGNLASKKEVEDAQDAKSVADMSRAKAIKSVFRIVTPKLSLKNIPMVVVNHTYKETGLFPKDVVSGGTGIYLSASWVWIIGRQQNKKDKDILGYHFVINIDKSRLVKEKSKLPISVTYDKGLMKYSGLLEIALAGEFVAKPSNGWYQVVDRETGELVGTKYREADIINNEEVWEPLLKNPDFQDYVNRLFAITPENGVESSEIFDPEALDE